MKGHIDDKIQVMNCSGYTFVLVHGAFHGGWCWNKLTPILESYGAIVHTPTLPSHHEDVPSKEQISQQEKFETVTLDNYRDHVIDLIQTITKKDETTRIILVCHSLSGIVGIRVAEKLPQSISAVVFLSAYVVNSMKTMKHYLKRDTESELVPEITIKLLKNSAIIDFDSEKISRALYTDCCEEDITYALARLCSERVLPMITPVHWTQEKFGSVKCAYVFTGRDKSISLQMQERMASHLPISLRYTLDTGHSSFYSQPQRLASILNDVVRSLRDSPVHSEIQKS